GEPAVPVHQAESHGGYQQGGPGQPAEACRFEIRGHQSAEKEAAKGQLLGDRDSYYGSEGPDCQPAQARGVRPGAEPCCDCDILMNGKSVQREPDGEHKQAGGPGLPTASPIQYRVLLSKEPENGNRG